MSKENPIVKGRLLESEGLESEYRTRGDEYRTDSVSVGAPIPEGWEVYKQLKTITRIRKKKTVATQLEDKIWRLLYDIGVEQLSEGVFTVLLKNRDGIRKTKQIDVVGIDQDTVFIVECKSKEQLGKKSLKAEIAEFAGNTTDFRAAFKNLLDNRDLEFVFVLATENIILDEVDRQDALEAGIQVWDEYDSMALQDLTNIAGQGAKYQIYGRIFKDKKIKGFDVKVAALEAWMGGRKYYTFVLTPEDLLKIAYVHHRTRQSSFLEVSESYQRVIKPARLRSVEQFINGGGSFPGNLILNFHKPFKDVQPLGTIDVRSKLSGKATPVVITLPPYYGSAWIIDGQHRLYGYADLDKKYSETVPVVAFVDESVSFESKVFVDVNKNQKAIEAALLWDLYEDLYSTSKDESERQLYAISVIAKLLNSEKDSPFFGHIKIPKEQIQKGNLTFTTICVGIANQKLISPKEKLLYRETWEDTIEFAAERIKEFFDVIRSEMKTEWEKGDEHYVRTNAGFVVFVGILRDLIECNLAPAELADIKKFRAAVYKFLLPVLVHLLDSNNAAIKEYRGVGGALQKSRQVRAEFVKIIQANVTSGFRSITVEQMERDATAEREAASSSRSLKSLLEQDEGERLEFKGSLITDLNSHYLGGTELRENPALLEEGALKTIVAFLNSKGGDLLIGVLEKSKFATVYESKLADYPLIGDYIVYGIAVEFRKDGWDGYQLRLQDWIKSRIGHDVFVDDFISISKLRYQGREVCIVSVKPSNSKQFLNDTKFYVRQINKTVELTGREIDQFWKSRNKGGLVQ